MFRPEPQIKFENQSRSKLHNKISLNYSIRSDFKKKIHMCQQLPIFPSQTPIFPWGRFLMRITCWPKVTQLLGGHLNTEIKPFRFSVLACVNDLILPENQHQLSYVCFIFFFESTFIIMYWFGCAGCLLLHEYNNWAFSSSGRWVGVGGQLLVVVHRLLNAVAYPCGAQAVVSRCSKPAQ